MKEKFQGPASLRDVLKTPAGLSDESVTDLDLRRVVEEAREKNKTLVLLSRLKDPTIQKQMRATAEEYPLFFAKKPDEIMRAINEAIERESSVTHVMLKKTADSSHYNRLTKKVQIGVRPSKNFSSKSMGYIEAHEKEHAIRAPLLNFAPRLSGTMSKGFSLWSRIVNKGLQMLLPAALAFDLMVLFGTTAAALYLAPQLIRSPYMNTSWEIFARMSQLKNYFGFGGEEVFSKAHLEYAKIHYVEDTGLDNGMSSFLSSITKKTEPMFLHMINNFGV